MSKSKYYVVWAGRRPGIYRSWAECAEQVNGYQSARYKSFESEAEAKAAFQRPWQEFIGVTRPANRPGKLPPEVIADSLAVDAACSGNPGTLEYRGVYTQTGQEVFHVGPLPNGTNNLGEFLAIVHALKLLHEQGKASPVYSDSRIALNWVREKQVRSKLPRTGQTEPVWSRVDQALDWLNSQPYSNPLIEWKTEAWGDIPADFGRK